MNVLIVTAYHLVLLEDYLLVATAMHIAGWQHCNATPWLTNHTDSRLDLLNVLTDTRFVEQCFLGLHADLRIVATARCLRLESQCTLILIIR